MSVLDVMAGPLGLALKLGVLFLAAYFVPLGVSLLVRDIRFSIQRNHLLAVSEEQILSVYQDMIVDGWPATSPATFQEVSKLVGTTPGHVRSVVHRRS